MCLIEGELLRFTAYRKIYCQVINFKLLVNLYDENYFERSVSGKVKSKIEYEGIKIHILGLHFSWGKTVGCEPSPSESSQVLYPPRKTFCFSFPTKSFSSIYFWGCVGETDLVGKVCDVLLGGFRWEVRS